MDAQSTVTSLIHDLLDAWNRKDKAAFRNHFTSTASYLTGDGEWRQGPLMIGELMDQPEVTTRVEVDGPVEVRDHGTIMTTIFRWRSLPDARRSGRGLVTCVLVNQDGGWLIDIMQNTEIVRGGEEPTIDLKLG